MGRRFCFLQECGLEMKSRQESKREVWRLGEVEICLDTWPWIPTFVEVEAPNEELIWSTVEKLGLSKEQARFGGQIYQAYYEVGLETIRFQTPRIDFEMTPPEWTKKIRPKK